MRVAALLALVTAVLAAAAPARAEDDPCLAQAPGATPVHLTASDGARIYGLELGTGTTGIVLVHQYLSDHCEWLDVAQELSAAGYRALTIDVRGYGASKVGRGSGVRIDRDVAAAAARLRAEGGERVILVGASMGGTAVLAAASWITPAVAGVVSLSGPANYRGLNALAAVRRSKVPVRFLASRDDTNFARDARTLMKAAVAKDKAIAVYPGGLHGSSLLGRPAAKALLFTFIKNRRAPSSARAAGGLFSYDASRPLGWRDAGATDNRDGITVRDVSYVSPKGGRVLAFLVLPAGSGPFPAVVWSPGSRGTREDLVEDARSLAKRGVAGLLPEPTGDPITCTQRDRTTMIRDVVDVRRGLDALAALPQIDATRLGAAGFSYGAMVSSVAAGVEPRLKAVVSQSGSGHLSQALTQFCGARPKVLTAVRPLDPVHWVGRLRTKVLVQNGRRDTVVPRAEALALARAARTAVRWYPALHQLNAQAAADRDAFLVGQLG